ncbi:MAG: hypothetical protein QOF46_3440, partial [Paraburkholderia sp.]|nr:hypothetical protein [Paraburkholderia sp.]
MSGLEIRRLHVAYEGARGAA